MTIFRPSQFLLLCSVFLFSLNSLAFSALSGFGPSTEHGARYSVQGRVFIGESGSRTAFGRFEDVDGEIIVEERLHSTEAAGRVQIQTASWQGVGGAVDTAVKRYFLRSQRYPQATLTIRMLRGIEAGSEIGSTTQGQLLGTLELVGESREVDIPVRIYRFSEGRWGVEPTAPLQLMLSRLGLSDERTVLNEVVSENFSDYVQVVFRLHLETDSQ